jgi:hypothetical protein
MVSLVRMGKLEQMEKMGRHFAMKRHAQRPTTRAPGEKNTGRGMAIHAHMVAMHHAVEMLVPVASVVSLGNLQSFMAIRKSALQSKKQERAMMAKTAPRDPEVFLGKTA